MLMNSHPLASIFQLGNCQLPESWAVLVQSDGSNGALSPVVHGDIVRNINIYMNIYTMH